MRQEKETEWEQRVLCMDEACIGVIGPDGRCKECGLPYDGEVKEYRPDSDDGNWDFEEEDHETADEDSFDVDEETTADRDSEWEQRKLCRDEACIGVIGPDGRCKECGLSYEGEEAGDEA